MLFRSGVFCNDQKVAPPKNLPLEEGLFGVGGKMLLSNYRNVQSAAKKSLGVRIYGSSGIEFIHVLTGKNVSYLSHLRPWDYAAGKILAETLGLVVKTIDVKFFNELIDIGDQIAPTCFFFNAKFLSTTL